MALVNQSLKHKVINLLIFGGVAALLMACSWYVGWQDGQRPEQVFQGYHILVYANPALWNLT